MSRSFGDQVAASVGVIAEPGKNEIMKKFLNGSSLKTICSL
jgi:hypothetical protein